MADLKNIISVSSRIRNAILGLAICLCLIFGGLLFLIVFIVEDGIFVKQLKAERNNYVQFQKSDKQTPWKVTNGNMYMAMSPQSLPEFLPKAFKLRVLNETGIHEYFDDQYAVFISHEIYADQSTFLIYDVSALLAVRGTKTALFSLIVFLTLVAGVSSIFIAGLLTRKTLMPIKELTNEIHNHGFNKSVIDRARQFSNDEIGILTKELALAIESQNAAAKREFEFNRGVSHELRTPIQVAQSSYELLAEINNQSDNKNASFNEPLTRLQRATEEMSEIAHAFLILSNEDTVLDQSSDTVSILKDLCHLNAGTHSALDFKSSVENTHRYTMDALVLRIILRHLIRNSLAHGNTDAIVIKFNDFSIIVRNQYDNIDKTNAGFGIGLSIVKALCERTGNDLQIIELDNPTVFEVHLILKNAGLKL